MDKSCLTSNNDYEIEIEGVDRSQSDINEDEFSEPVGPDENACCTSTVLLADDNPFNLMPLRVILEEEYQIYCDLVENGLEEVQAFVRNREKTCCDVRYKLVLTDLNMPEMDGFDATRNIYKYQNENNQPLIPIIAVTAYDDEQTFETCMEIGMPTVLQKPVSADLLGKVIKKYYFARTNESN